MIWLKKGRIEVVITLWEEDLEERESWRKAQKEAMLMRRNGTPTRQCISPLLRKGDMMRKFAGVRLSCPSPQMG